MSGTMEAIMPKQDSSSLPSQRHCYERHRLFHCLRGNWRHSGAVDLLCGASEFKDVGAECCCQHAEARGNDGGPCGSRTGLLRP